MSDIDDILAQYDYAETITQTFADGALTATLAEAHPQRNREFAKAFLKEIADTGAESVKDLGEDAEIRVFCASLLKSWDAQRGGKPIAVEDAGEFFSGSRAGLNLFREMSSVCAQPARFRGAGPSKKKRSSSSTRNRSSSAKKPKSSGTRRKPAATKSRSASATT